MTVQTDILKSLAEHPDGLTCNDMARELQREPATIGGSLARMIYLDRLYVAGTAFTEKGNRVSVYKAGKKPAGLVVEERTVKVVAHLTPAEHQTLRDAATAAHKHPATFMRETALKACEVADA